MTEPKQCDYVCLAEYSGEQDAELFVLTYPEGTKPTEFPQGEYIKIYLDHWKSKTQPPPSGRLYIGLPPDDPLTAAREGRCFTVHISATTLPPSKAH